MKMIQITHTKNQRAKNRVSEHGNIFKIIKDLDNHINPNSILLECLNDNCKWCGWFSKSEIDYNIYVNEK